MPTYSLRYATDGLGEAKRIDFEASDPAMALELVKAEVSNRHAELWDACNMLCLMKYGDDGVWQLSGSI
ncbi:MAG: hypothetical protein R3E04_12790 [Sphingobium sp.]